MIRTFGRLRSEGIPFRDTFSENAENPMYSQDELSEALRAINSLIGKCEKSFVQLVDGAPQHTLMQRRLAALNISAELIKKEMGE